jgi:hypothetical protein
MWALCLGEAVFSSSSNMEVLEIVIPSISPLGVCSLQLPSRVRSAVSLFVVRLTGCLACCLGSSKQLSQPSYKIARWVFISELDFL